LPKNPTKIFLGLKCACNDLFCKAHFKRLKKGQLIDTFYWAWRGHYTIDILYT